MNRYILILFIFFFTRLHGQDFHFSQFYNSPLNLNPALTGIYDIGFWRKDIRFSGNFRDQWRSIPSNYLSTPTPFKTTSFSTDVKIRNARFLHRDFFAVGLSFFSDKAGDLDFSTRQINISLSYSKKLDYYGNRFLTVGLMSGVSRRNVDYTNAVFDNQWTGTNFDPSKATGESFPGLNYNYKDYSAGLVYSSIPTNKLNFTAGFAIFHFNRPNQTFIKNKDYKVLLYPTFITHSNAQIHLPNKKVLLPSVLYLRQGPAGEFNIMNYLQFQPLSKDKLNYQFGLGYRIVGNYQKTATSDALITAFKLLYNNIIFTFSYDANTSSLKQATKTIGGFEISLICYEFFNKNGKPRESRQRPSCPRFDSFQENPEW